MVLFLVVVILVVVGVVGVVGGVRLTCRILISRLILVFLTGFKIFMTTLDSDSGTLTLTPAKTSEYLPRPSLAVIS